MTDIEQNVKDSFVRVHGKWVSFEELQNRRIMTFQTVASENDGHIYVDIDGIRLVYEALKDKSQFSLVGWYRPDGWL